MHRQSKQLSQDLTDEETLLITIRIAEADEAYVIGKRGQYTPVGAYLAGDEIIKIALQHGVQMIHPGMKTRSPTQELCLILRAGYGFLSENAGFARSVEKAGLIVRCHLRSYIRCLGLATNFGNSSLSAPPPKLSTRLATKSLPEFLRSRQAYRLFPEPKEQLTSSRT
jgi:pyruvate carboxylase